MPAPYQKIYDKNGRVGYVRSGGTPDHVFLWTMAGAPSVFNALNDLLGKFDPVAGTLLFCPLFDLTKIAAAIDALVISPAMPSCQGKLAYWRDQVFTGLSGPFNTFPNGNGVPIVIGDVDLSLDLGTPANKLSDFTIGADATGSNLSLKMAGAEWSIDDASGGDTVIVKLDPTSGFVAGGVGLAVAWPASGTPHHPLRRCGLVFTAAPKPDSGGDPSACRVWTACLSDLVIASAGSGAICRVHLDPRDGKDNPQWLNNGMNSSFQFGDARVHSSFYTARGDRFVLIGSDTATSRLGFIYDKMRPDQTLDSTFTQTIFHPNGTFQALRLGIGDPSSTLKIGARDFVAGSAATEFFDLSPATHIEFVEARPCFFIDGEGGPATSQKLLDGKNGVAITSYVRFAEAAAGPPANVPVDLHSQPAEAPLFVASATATDPLLRRRQRIGQSMDPVPVFPRAGYTPSSEAANQDILRYDTTHLSQFRRNTSRQTQKTIVQEAVESNKEITSNDGAAGSFAITPQGILASIDAAGNYTRLYFGNPDTQALHVDFSMGICPSDANLFAGIQNALAGNHLFMVLNKPAPTTLNTISPSASIFIRDFQFSVGPAGSGSDTNRCGDAAAPVSMNASVVIVKFISGKSIDTLIQDPSQWACQIDLAPTGNVGIRELTHLDDPIPPNSPDYLKDLRAIWSDEKWQGILVLDLAIPPGGMPSTLEALRPGLPQAVALRANHLGLNVVPARKTDVQSSNAPQRPGSAFGLIRYEKADQDQVKSPDSNDKEPGAATDPVRSYEFVLQSLHVEFENSQIATFDAKLFVKFDYLFWDEVSPDDGKLKSIELDGNYESRTLPDGTKQDVFSLISPNQIEVDFPAPSLLQRLTITRAQLNVQSISTGKSLSAVIDIDGTLTLEEKLASCPLFTVQAIRLSSFGFEIDYDYPKNGTPANFRFGFSAPRISADIDFSPAEGQLMSMLNFLPLKLKGMSIALSDLLDLGTLNFSPISFPGLDPGGLTGTKFHFGFLMDLDLGSLGQLAGDLSGLKLPLLLGWRGGKDPDPHNPIPRIAFGIQFPTFNGKIDIGIQQFIRLQADRLNLQRCLDNGNVVAFAIQAVNARVVLLGKSFPQQDLAFVIFVPTTSNRKMSWALGLKGGQWYVGGGYRITIDGSAATDTKDVVSDFEALLNADTGNKICTLLNLAAPSSDNWGIAAEYSGFFDIAIAVADPGMYGINLQIADFDIDLFYRKVAGQLGIFSVEFTIPGPMREIQFGAATIRLPVLRLEIHTDGGFLADFGYPWNNNFARSAQVEVAIFLGSGGYYYGITSALASDLIRFTGGYGFLAPDDTVLAQFKRTVRAGFAARVGIGRSFTIGILSAEASITIFGGIEGAVSYKPGETDLFKPTIYAIRGFVGLMLDITATVDFAIIQASARIQAYVDVGLELRRVLAKRQNGNHCIIALPLVVFADVGLNISIAVKIHVGCFDITIYLSFSATWHFEEALFGLSDGGDISFHLSPTAGSKLVLQSASEPTNWPPAAPFAWPTTYRYWNTPRAMNIYAAALPCMGDSADFGLPGGKRTCVVGTMMMQVTPDTNCFGDLVRFLSGWVVLNGQVPTTDPEITLGGNLDLQSWMKTGLCGLLDLQAWMKTEVFWGGFPTALMQVIGAQFTTAILNLSSTLQNEPFAVIPLWPGYSFSYLLPGGGRTTGNPAKVTEHMAKYDEGQKAVLPDDVVMNGDMAAFSEYCRHLITSAVAEMITIVRNTAGESTNDSGKSLKWSQIWSQMFGN